MTLVVGLTGGIGSGKSTVAELFARRGVPVIDTDRLAHALTASGGKAIRALALAFGAACLTPEGSLDRAAMRRRILADPSAKSRLEDILHPLIRAEAEAALLACRSPYALVVVPLLVETGQYDRFIQRVLVVDCPEETQVARAVARGGLTEDEARAFLARQAPRAQRLARADDVVDNGGAPEELPGQVEALHRRYLELAGAQA